MCCAVLCCAVLCCAVLCIFLYCSTVSNLCKPLLTTAEQRQWLEEKGGRKKKGQIGCSLQPGSSPRVTQDQSEAQHSRKDSNVKMKMAEPAAGAAKSAQPDRYGILSASEPLINVAELLRCCACKLVFCFV